MKGENGDEDEEAEAALGKWAAEHDRYRHQKVEDR